MKAGIIFAGKTTWRSRLDLEYLDETSSRKVSGASFLRRDNIAPFTLVE